MIELDVVFAARRAAVHNLFLNFVALFGQADPEKELKMCLCAPHGKPTEGGTAPLRLIRDGKKKKMRVKYWQFVVGYEEKMT